MGRLLGTDFESIFMDFGSQIGAQNRQNVGPRMHRKNDEKKKTSKMANKSVRRRPRCV